MFSLSNQTHLQFAIRKIFFRDSSILLYLKPQRPRWHSNSRNNAKRVEKWVTKWCRHTNKCCFIVAFLFHPLLLLLHQWLAFFRTQTELPEITAQIGTNILQNGLKGEIFAIKITSVNAEVAFLFGLWRILLQHALPVTTCLAECKITQL